MADNIVVNSEATTPAYTVATDKVTFSGDANVEAQIVRPAHVTGSEGSKTVEAITATTGTPAAASMSVHDLPATSGGLSTYHVVSAASDNAQNVKASAGQVFHVSVFNVHTAPIYLKFHNDAGVPTAGASVVRTVGVQAGVHVSIPFPKGLAFSTGIAISIVAGIADNSAAAVGAAHCVVDIGYK